MLGKIAKGLKKNKGDAKHADKSEYLKHLFSSGNVIQLFSRVTGHTLQRTYTKEELDGHGLAKKDAASTLWTIHKISDEKEELIVHIYQDQDFLSIVDGETKLSKFDNPLVATDETKFKISYTEQFVRLELADGCGHHVGILPSGSLKAAIATGNENASHFAPRVVVKVSKSEDGLDSVDVTNSEPTPVCTNGDDPHENQTEIKENGITEHEDKPLLSDETETSTNEIKSDHTE